MGKRKKAKKPSCIGYPDCEGELEGVDHTSPCPMAVGVEGDWEDPHANPVEPPSDKNDRPLLEAVIQKFLIARLNAMPHVHVWRANAGAAFDKTGRLVKFGVKGQADVQGIVESRIGGQPYGIALFVEVKREKGGVLSPQQVAFGRMVSLLSAIHCVVASTDDALALVAKLQAMKEVP